MEKSYLYKVYKRNDTGGWQTDPVAIWAKEVVSEPSFTLNINGADGELNIKLARDFDNFGEDDDVRLANEVQLYCYDREYPDGVLIFRGYISSYQTILDHGKEYINVRVISYGTKLSHVLVESDGSTGVQYLSSDPSEILMDIMDGFRTEIDRIYYTSASIPLTNNTVTYTFNANTVREAIDVCLELAPERWFWRVDPDGLLTFKAASAIADHTLYIGKDVENLEVEKSIENQINRVYFVGGTPDAAQQLYFKRQGDTSVDRFMPTAVKEIDQRVTVSGTVNIRTNTILNLRGGVYLNATLTVLDNNGGDNSKGYDIESLKPGQMVQLRNFANQGKQALYDVSFFDVDSFDSDITGITSGLMQITRVRYYPDRAELELSNKGPTVARRIEDINRNLEEAITYDIPVTPEEL